MTENPHTAGIILAGGKASRMAFVDKPLLAVNGRTLIEHVIKRASAEIDDLALGVNHNLGKYEFLQLPLITDTPSPIAGPLIGIHSAMQWFRKRAEYSKHKYLACFPADVPVFPSKLVEKLTAALERTESDVAYACCAEQIQPLFSVWKLDTMAQIGKSIENGIHGPKLIFPLLKSCSVEFSIEHPADFLNINEPADMRRLESLYCELSKNKFN